MHVCTTETMYMKRCLFCFTGAVLVLLIICAGCVTQTNPADSHSPAVPEGMNESMEHVSAVIVEEFDRIAAEVAGTAAEVAGRATDDPQAVKSLRNLYANNTWAIGVIYFNVTTGTYRMEPMSQEEIPPLNITEGDFSESPAIFRGPFYSGWQGQQITVVAPVYENGTYRGFVSMRMQPKLFMQHLGSRLPELKTYEAWAALTDGTVIYSVFSEQVGTDVYPEQAGSSVPENSNLTPLFESGTGAYTLQSYTSLNKKVEKTGVWQWIDVLDTRIILSLLWHEPEPFDLTSIPEDPDISGLVATVQDAYQYIKEHGKEAAIPYINDPETFATNDYSVSVYTMNGTVLAMGHARNLVGTNQLNAQDGYAITPVGMMILRAKQGSGYVHYMYATTDEVIPREVLPKLGYVMQVDEDCFIEASMIVTRNPIPVDLEKKQLCVNMTEQAYSYQANYGKEALAAEMMDPDGVFSTNRNVFVGLMDYNGTILACTNQPALVGQNAFSFTDSHGDSVSRELVLFAKRGGGHTYLCLENVTSGNRNLYLVYTQPVDDTWLIASGVFLTEIENSLHR